MLSVVSTDSDLIDDWSHLGLPPVGNQVDHLILGCILDATEHVTQIFIWVDVVSLAFCQTATENDFAAGRWICGHSRRKTE